MNKKSFFFGILTGIVLTFVGSFVIVSVNQKLEDSAIQYLENPVSYENKKETSFRVFQVLGNKALANEVSSKGSCYEWYLGNTVLLLGDNYYNDQVVNVKNPQRVGTFKYITKEEETVTVPIIGGQME